MSNSFSIIFFVLFRKINTLLLANCSINIVVLTANVSFSPLHQALQSSLSTMSSVSLYQNCKFDLAIIISDLWR